MSSKEKYLKYKKKYLDLKKQLELKKQLGSGREDELREYRTKLIAWLSSEPSSERVVAHAKLLVEKSEIDKLEILISLRNEQAYVQTKSSVNFKFYTDVYPDIKEITSILENVKTAQAQQAYQA